MASVRERNGRFYIRYRDADGKQHEIAAQVRTAKQADRLAGEVERHLEPTVQHSGRSLTVEQAWVLFEEEVLPGKREATRIAYRSAMNHNWLPAIGVMGLKKVQPLDVRRALERMGLARSTQLLRRNQLSGLYNWAIERGYAVHNPCKGLKIDVPDESTCDTLAPRYLKLLVEHAPPDIRPAIMVLAYAGLRVGEVRGLRWRDVDFENGVIHVERVVYREGAEALRLTGEPFSDPKSRRGHRPVQVPEVLLDELSRWAKVTRNCEENRWDLVFPAKQWGPLRHDALGKYVSIAAAAIADLPEVAPSARQDGEERYDPDVITPRTLRHAYARLMLSLAMSLPELQLQMGHAKYSTTLRYARYELRDRPYAVRAFDSWVKTPKHSKYLRPDIDDVRKHALGKLDGKDIGDYYVGKNVGKGEA